MERNGGALVEVSKMGERRDEIFDAVRLLNLAGGIVIENPYAALEMVSCAREYNLKEVEQIADALEEYAHSIIEDLESSPDPKSAAVFKFEPPTRK
jgi:hypothetical protein